ncbi:MAG: hypothetical protein WD768_05400 [Phycisphaeraceae bacterium]
MSSSIFNSDAVAWFGQMTRRDRLWAALVLLCGLVAVFVVALALRDYVKPDNEHTRALATITPRTQVVFLGSSHVLAGVDAASMQTPAVNLSGAAHDPTCMRAVFAGNLPRLPGLKTVFVEVDPYFLQANSVHHFNGDYRRIFDLDAEVSALNVERADRLRVVYHHGWYRSMFWPLVAFQKPSPRRLVWGTEEGEMLPGFMRRDLREDLAAHAAARFKEHGGNAELANVPRNREALQLLVHDAKAAGARIILLRMPIHISYRRLVPDAWNQLTEDTLAQLRSELGADSFEWWDFNALIEWSDEDFSDSDHLHITGAAKLTRYIDERLKQGAAPSPGPAD